VRDPGTLEYEHVANGRRGGLRGEDLLEKIPLPELGLAPIHRLGRLKAPMLIDRVRENARREGAGGASSVSCYPLGLRGSRRAAPVSTVELGSRSCPSDERGAGAG
jgi:hypothetical protein